jgi:hypothetical protein
VSSADAGQCCVGVMSAARGTCAFTRGMASQYSAPTAPAREFARIAVSENPMDVASANGARHRTNAFV